MWDGFDQSAATFERDDFVKVQARVENYRNKMQLAIDKIRRAEENEVDPADFFPHTKEDVEQLYGRLLERVASVGNPWLRQLLDSVVRDPKLFPTETRARRPRPCTMRISGACSNTSSACADLCRVGSRRIIRRRMRIFC